MTFQRYDHKKLIRNNCLKPIIITVLTNFLKINWNHTKTVQIYTCRKWDFITQRIKIKNKGTTLFERSEKCGQPCSMDEKNVDIKLNCQYNFV